MKYNTIKILSLFLAVLFTAMQQAGYAQNAAHTLTGKVTDQFGNPVYGAVVNSGNGKNGTATDKKGDYILPIDDGSATVTFKYTGYLIAAESIGEKETINVQLSPDAHKLDEEIQLGYNSQLRRNFTGAAATITGTELERSPVANFGQTLAGRLAGLTALETYSELSRATTSMSVRGISFGRNTGPLVVVDGVLVPYNSDQTLAYISPTEIESIAVLKDASTQALYGILGGNGLLVVKTKRGRKGGLEMRARIDQSVQQATTTPTHYDAATYAELRNLAAKNDYMPGGDPFEAPYSDAAVAAYKSGSDRALYPNNNWYSMYMKDLAKMERVSVNLTGGSDKVQYFTNLNVMHQGGYFKTEQPRYDANANNIWVNYRTNVDMNINKWIKAYVRLSGNIKRERTPGGGSNQDVYSSIFSIPSNVFGPLTPEVTDGSGKVIDPGGEVISNAPYIHNPAYGLLNRSGYVRHTVTNTTSQFGIDLNLDFITKGLSLTGTFNYQTNSVGSLATTQNYTRVVRDANIDDSLAFSPDGSDLNTPLAYGKSSSFYYHLTYNALLNYERSFGKHNVRALGYMFYQDLTKTDVNPPFSFPYKRIHTGAEVTYDYSGKYFVKLDLGYSGSDQYATSSRYTSTPSIGAGWLISNEAFLKNNKVLSLLKIRGSYGKTANDQNGLPYRFLYMDDVRLTGGGPIGSLQYLVTENLRGDERISAEVSTKLNAGIDIGLFNAITITADVFNEKVNNLLVPAIGTIPAYQGIPLANYPSLNEGKFKNQGFEVSVDYTKEFNKNWGASIGGNLSYSKNTVVSANEAERSVDYAYKKQQEGYSVGQQFGYLVDYSNGNGMVNSQQELDNNTLAYTFGTPRVGDLKYKDLNGDGKLNDRDLAPIGHGSLPRYVYGINGSVRFKSVELNVLFQGVGDFTTIYNGPGVYEASYGGLFGALHNQSWTAERYAAGDAILYPALSAQQSVNHQASDFFAYDRSFIRLKNLELSYTFSNRVANAIAAQNIRLLLSGQNLITWDKMKSKDFGPEGSGYLGFPVYRVYNLGLSVTF
jgi:TonB-linked SusC/RagA family outer membrane protein